MDDYQDPPAPPVPRGQMSTSHRGVPLQLPPLRGKTINMEHDPGLSLDGRLGKLEGLMIGLQASVTQAQTNFAAYASRIDTLEQRQIKLEREMMTRTEIKELIEKVDAIAKNQNQNEGNNEGTKWTIQQGLIIFSALVAASALVLTVIDRNPPDPLPQLQNQR